MLREQEFVGDNFFDEFWFWDAPDPTHSAVRYVDAKTARAENLTYVDSYTNKFVMQVDYEGKAVPLGQTNSTGRKSVRIHSKRLFGDGLYVIKASHMPVGCGTWPAFWTSNKGDWPVGGEIDIIEGVYNSKVNMASLHTLDGCMIPKNVSTIQQGHLDRTNCSYQPGCASSFSDKQSWGDRFNTNNGGYFAMMRDTQLGGLGIQVWFWPAFVDPQEIPLAVSAAARKAPGTVDTVVDIGSFGAPQAFFGADMGSKSSCEMSKLFHKHEIIFNIALCENGSQLSNARWEVDYVRIYSAGAGTFFF
ncbi:hypothetical protein MVES_001720 [Malassezia vespertilionis]|uniref:GH16 domain-containing protein n=1 Tax=Malassezia vespertilionis TaxID=2020962 RepID=A0A2N1JD64_9BASI|nr:hypothetical protein MVES_001720 [Malassezia vespertilionis]